MSLPVRQSLVSQCVQILRDGIRYGEWEQHLPGELALCRRLQVSRVTLRAALAQLEAEGLLKVSKGRKREIQEPKRKSRTMSGILSRVVILSPVPWGGLTAAKLLWIDELRDLLSLRQVTLEFVVSKTASSQRPDRVLRDLTAQYSGVVWLLLRSTEQMQQWFVAHCLPAVVAGSVFEGVELPGVDSDYYAACRHAAGKLLARGCQRLGLVIPQVLLAGDQESEAGFRAGAGAHPVAVARHDGSPDGLGRALDTMLKKDAPQGLLVCHATHAVTVLGRLVLRGVQLPRDMKLISRDDDPFLLHVTPDLARYSLRPSFFALRLARAIGNWLEGDPHAGRIELLVPDFVDGETL